MIDPTTSRFAETCGKVAKSISGVILLAVMVLGIRRGTDFCVTADQRGQLLMNKQEYSRAATTFNDPLRAAVASYRAGDFEKAASVWSGLPGAEAAYNQGNALVMLGKYTEAIAQYDRALQLRPGWAAATTNRDIARGRADRLDVDPGNMTGGELGADDYVFDLSKQTAGAESEQVEAGQEMSDEEMRALWLRQVQTTPGDFLKAKFAYQRAMEQEGVGGEDE